MIGREQRKGCTDLLLGCRRRLHYFYSVRVASGYGATWPVSRSHYTNHYGGVAEIFSKTVIKEEHYYRQRKVQFGSALRHLIL